MKLQKKNFPLSVKDYLVTHEEFTLIFNSEKEMLLTDPQPTTNQLYKYYAVSYTHLTLPTTPYV